MEQFQLLQEQAIKHLVFTGPVGAKAEPSWTRIETSNAQFTVFDPQYNQGVFAARAIPAGTILCDSNGHPCFNDAAMDLRGILAASTSNELNHALEDAQEAYYQPENMAKANVAMAMTGPSSAVFVTTRDVQEGEELLRVYGWSTWIKELCELGILKAKVFFGLLTYAHWFFFTCHFIDHDPFFNYLGALMTHGDRLIRELCPGLTCGTSLSCERLDEWFKTQENRDDLVQVDPRGFQLYRGTNIVQLLGSAKSH